MIRPSPRRAADRIIDGGVSSPRIGIDGRYRRSSHKSRDKAAIGDDAESATSKTRRKGSCKGRHSRIARRRGMRAIRYLRSFIEDPPRFTASKALLDDLPSARRILSKSIPRLESATTSIPIPSKIPAQPSDPMKRPFIDTLVIDRLVDRIHPLILVLVYPRMEASA